MADDEAFITAALADVKRRWSPQELVAIGQEKAPAVAAMVEGPVTPLCPASVLQRHPRAAVVLDEAAASRLGSATR